MVYRGTRGFLPFLGSRRGVRAPLAGSGPAPGSPDGAPAGTSRAPDGRRGGAGAASGAGSGAGRRLVEQGPWCLSEAFRRKGVKRAKNDHFWSILTIFGFKMRFFIFERFVNPARDAFPVCLRVLRSSAGAASVTDQVKGTGYTSTKTRDHVAEGFGANVHARGTEPQPGIEGYMFSRTVGENLWRDEIETEEATRMSSELDDSN